MSTLLFKSSTLPAITFGADPAQYHKMGAEFRRGDPRFIMSRGELITFSKCPSKWIRGVQDEETSFMEWGSLVDVLKLTPERFGELYEFCPETYQAEGSNPKGSPRGTPKPLVAKPWNRNADFCREWEAEVEKVGKKPIKKTKYEEARQAVARLNGDAIMGSVFEGASTQVQACADYVDPETGITVRLRTLLDVVPSLTGPWGNHLGDLKTTGDASPHKYQRTVFEQGWHKQAGFYIDVYNAATGEQRNQWLHLIQESESPYEPARRQLDEEFLNLGRSWWQLSLARYCRCLKTQVWDGYDDLPSIDGEIVNGFRMVTPSPWMMLQD